MFAHLAFFYTFKIIQHRFEAGSSKPFLHCMKNTKKLPITIKAALIKAKFRAILQKLGMKFET